MSKLRDRCASHHVVRSARSRPQGILATHKDGARVRAEPFDAVELDLGILWADVVLDE